jgi:hypothetical protein
MTYYYNTNQLSYLDKINILKDANSVAIRQYIDTLTCDSDNNCQRNKLDMTFADIMTHFDISCHFFLRHRCNDDDKYSGEIGFYTMKQNVDNYNLKFRITQESLKYIIDKYNLQIQF